MTAANKYFQNVASGLFRLAKRAARTSYSLSACRHGNALQTLSEPTRSGPGHREARPTHEVGTRARGLDTGMASRSAHTCTSDPGYQSKRPQDKTAPKQLKRPLVCLPSTFQIQFKFISLIELKHEGNNSHASCSVFIRCASEQQTGNQNSIISRSTANPVLVSELILPRHRSWIHKSVRASAG